MSVRQPVADPRRPGALRVAAAQVAMHDLRAGSSIVAVEGALQLGFRDHSLAWLGDAVPLTSLALHEGERFVMPQRGVVTISAMQAQAAAFIVLCPSTDHGVQGLVRRAAHRLAALVRTRLGRAA
ncbi:hypothetical protein FVF58_13670 [Paraburkholderia panacisoli]|uniref:Uncharacterized protein n=1 Tax=Paraburkholderia panacisoli TaxID=2603818 RepID=A0A5B0HAU8_9BURK|nr:hypothetical protein [Paraburkholderia panacisoli]KAA1012152.1 hypothetical protein FVF58_13670 [Paraburkholderia panacisoli]